jgi:hypothetical protein
MHRLSIGKEIWPQSAFTVFRALLTFFKTNLQSALVGWLPPSDNNDLLKHFKIHKKYSVYAAFSFSYPLICRVGD